MPRTITPNKDLSKKATEEKLRAEIKQLEAVVKKLPPVLQNESPELAQLAEKLGRLHKNKPLFRNNYGSNRISRCDATLRGSWIQDPFGASAPVDTDWSDEERDTSSVGDADSDFCREAKVGYISESPERPGPRFQTPSWVKDLNLLGKFSRVLIDNRVKEYPALAEFETSKSEVECLILFNYFVEHLSFEGLWAKFSRPASEFQDIRVEDAGGTVEGALCFLAEKNGTTAGYDSDDPAALPTVFWESDGGFYNVVSIRKVNHEIYRAEISSAEDDRYYLPEKLDPSKKGSRGLQRYIADLVDQGYESLKITKPVAEDREVRRQERVAEEERGEARAQYGTGTSGVRYEHLALPDQSHRPSQAGILQAEHRRIVAWENQLKAEIETKATAGLNSFQLRQREQERGEQAFQKLMAATKAAEAVAKATRPWQPPVVEPEPAATPTPVPVPAPAIRPEVLLMSIQLLLATVAQGSWQVAA